MERTEEHGWVDDWIDEEGEGEGSYIKGDVNDQYWKAINSVQNTRPLSNRQRQYTLKKWKVKKLKVPAILVAMLEVVYEILVVSTDKRICRFSEKKYYS